MLSFFLRGPIFQMFALFTVKVFKHLASGEIKSNAEGYAEFKAYSVWAEFGSLASVNKHGQEDWVELAPVFHQLLKLPESYTLDGIDITLMDTYQALPTGVKAAVHFP